MRFVTYQDNGGQFHWRLVDDDGSRLAVSAGSFASAEEATRAAADVHARAGTAPPVEP